MGKVAHKQSSNYEVRALQILSDIKSRERLKCGCLRVEFKSAPGSIYIGKKCSLKQDEQKKQKH